MDEFARTIGVIAEAAARRSGRDPNDFAVRNVAGAIVGVIMAATMPWSDWAEDTPGTRTCSTGSTPRSRTWRPAFPL